MIEYSCIGCGAFSPERYCPACKPKPRPNFRQRGYGAFFERQRKIRLRLTPWCEMCAERGIKTRANVADHIIRKRDGGSDHHTNLRALCRSCHSKHTADESPGGWNA